jgi:signal transduction histidine kinase
MVESAAYLVACEATSDARRRGASRLHVLADAIGGHLVLEILDDAAPGRDAHAVLELADRIGSLEGRLTVTGEAGGGTKVRVELPCGS